MDHNSITAHSEHMVRPCRCTFVTCDGKPYVTHVTEDPEVLKPWEENMNDNSPLPKTNVDIPMPEVKPPRDSLKEPTPYVSPEPAKYTVVVRDVPLSLQVWKDGSHLSLAFLEWLRSQVGKQLVVEAADEEWLEYNDYHTADEVGWRLRAEWLADIKPVWKPRKGERVRGFTTDKPGEIQGWYEGQTPDGKHRVSCWSETVDEIRPIEETAY